jgi:hypothetical protein
VRHSAAGPLEIGVAVQSFEAGEIFANIDSEASLAAR